MKRHLAAILAVLMLNACQWQTMPEWSDVPGQQCRLITHRIGVRVSRGDGVHYKESENKGRIVTLRESEEQKLRAYLQQFVEKGQRSYNTYAPRTVLYGHAFSLNFLTDTVVLNIGTGSQKQYTRPRGAADDAILQLVRKRSDSRSLKQ